MDSFLFALKAVLPIGLMVALGYFLKRKGFMTAFRPVFPQSQTDTCISVTQKLSA